MTWRYATSAPSPHLLDELELNGSACLVLDLHLPVIGGFAVMNTLARRGLRLPVIVITGRGDAQTKARALQAGAVAFLEKPVDDKSLMAAIRTAPCASRHTRRAPGRRAANSSQHGRFRAPIPASPRRPRSPCGPARVGCAPPSSPITRARWISTVRALMFR